MRIKVEKGPRDGGVYMLISSGFQTAAPTKARWIRTHRFSPRTPLPRLISKTFHVLLIILESPILFNKYLLGAW